MLRTVTVLLGSAAEDDDLAVTIDVPAAAAAEGRAAPTVGWLKDELCKQVLTEDVEAGSFQLCVADGPSVALTDGCLLTPELSRLRVLPVEKPSEGASPRSSGSGTQPVASKPLWKVTGGEDRGGIIVRLGQELDSSKAPERLSTGALVWQEELAGERLRYRLARGSGPATGWVGTRLGEKDLLVLADRQAAEALLTPASATPAADVVAAAGKGGGTSEAKEKAWRLFAISDLHVDYAENKAWVGRLPETGYELDAVILAGDISHSAELVRWTLREFKRRFAHVFYCVGNHELWVKRDDAKSDGAKVFADSREKFEHLMAVAAEAGALTAPTKLASALWVVPLQSWYESEFGKPGEEAKRQAKALFTDHHQCVWPATVGTTPDDASRFFDSLNEDPPPAGYDAPVVSFSHFLPRLELLPSQLPRHMELLRAGVGTQRLERRLRAIGSKLHVFGHSHINWYTHWDGVHYVQNAMRYPQERKLGASRIDVAFKPDAEDLLKPFLIWSSGEPENFCLQPERCGRGCARALASSVYYKNSDSKDAARTWAAAAATSAAAPGGGQQQPPAGAPKQRG